VSDPKTFGRDLRAFWATLAVICLLGAGVAYGVTRYRLMELEQQAGREAHKVAVDVIQPALTAGDVSAPIHGDRLAEVRSTIEGRALEGPIDAVRIWSGDGTVVFADDPKVIGQRDPTIREEIQTSTGGTSVHGFTTGERFHSLVVMHVGEPAALMAAEFVLSHAAMLAKAKDPWYPWMTRAIRFAIAFAVLYVVTWIGFATFSAVRRGIRHRKAAATRPRVPGRRGAVADEDLPAYMHPGFQAEVEGRRVVEQELTSARAERDALARRLQETETELQQSKSAASVGESS
jgi:hypothetical protein